MKAVYLTNYFNHHQQPLSQQLCAKCDSFFFVETGGIPEYRKTLGYSHSDLPDYVLNLNGTPGQRQRCLEAIRQADLLILGSVSGTLVRQCARSGKLVFRASERPLKKGAEWEKYLPRLLKWRWIHHGKRLYLLSASAYSAGDFRRFGLFRGKAFKWGYFPPLRRYSDPNEILADKDPALICWAGRLLDWKHPADAVEAASRLWKSGHRFRMEIYGDGPEKERLQEQILEAGLEDTVFLCGAVPPPSVRDRMEKAGIFLVTSDRREGWGAVVNEAMNSCCAVVASQEAGAVPYLLEDASNGRVFHCGRIDELSEALGRLLDNPAEQRRMGLAAYQTIESQWNAEIAAERLLSLAQQLVRGEKADTLFPDGPCSPAAVIREEKNKL